jgi:hypothetical protein
MDSISLVTVNWFSAKYIGQLLKNILNKARHPDNIKVYIIDNTNGQDIALKEAMEHDSSIKIYPFDTHGIKGGQAHGLALSYAMDLIDSCHTLIIDPDVYIFKNHWDEFCINKLKTNNYIAIGAPYPSWRIGKYHNFPSPIFCFSHTKKLKSFQSKWLALCDYKWQNALVFMIRQVGRMAGLVSRRRYEKYPLIKFYGEVSEKLFGVFTLDAGWRIAREAARKNMRSILFIDVLSKDIEYAPRTERGISAFRALAHQYELFYFDKEPILTHKYSSGSRVWRTERGDDENFWRENIAQLERELDKTF